MRPIGKCCTISISGRKSVLDENRVPVNGLVELISALLHEAVEQDVVGAQVSVLVVEDGDVHLGPRQRLDDQPLGSLHVQTEVVHGGVAQSKKNGVQREARNSGNQGIN